MVAWGNKTQAAQIGNFQFSKFNELILFKILVWESNWFYLRFSCENLSQTLASIFKCNDHIYQLESKGSLFYTG